MGEGSEDVERARNRRRPLPPAQNDGEGVTVHARNSVDLVPMPVGPDSGADAYAAREDNEDMCQLLRHT